MFAQDGGHDAFMAWAKMLDDHKGHVLVRGNVRNKGLQGLQSTSASAYANDGEGFGYIGFIGFIGFIGPIGFI
jgi:hypothetical protein